MNYPSAPASQTILKVAPGHLSALRFWGFFLGLFVITALPILRAELPPFVDYPNHLARMHVLIAQPTSEALQRYYEIHWRPLPNLAMDLTVPLLARIMPLERAGKVFILICLGLLAGGVALLHRAATRQWSVWPLSAFLLLYSRPLIWGFLNYVCGIGLAFTAFALWLALAKRASALRVAAASACALLIFFVHLEACAIFGLLIAGHEIGEIWRQRVVSSSEILTRMLAIGVPFLAPIAIFFADGFGGSLGDIRYDFLSKLGGLWISDGHPVLDVVGTLALLLPAGYFYFKGHVTIVPALRVPMLLVTLAYLFTPNNFISAHGIDERLPLAIFLLLAAGTTSLNLTAIRIRMASLVGLALFLVRVGVVEADFERANEVYPRLLAILDQVPQGGRLAVASGPNMIGSNGLPFNHLPTLAVIRRDAFVTTLFAQIAQQPVTFTPQAGAMSGAANMGGKLWPSLMDGEGSVRQALEGFDALVVVDGEPFVVPAMSYLIPIASEPNFTLYRVAH